MTTLFHRLLYTNCLPGQGLSEGGGFGIQALSPDTPQAVFKAATENLLYVAPAKWTNSGMPAEAYPRSIAHISEPGLGTSQGRYLGDEAVGGRSGNHVTDCVLATEGSSYGLLRPAQLWGAAIWREEPWPTNACPSIEDYLEPGELTTDELAAWVKSDERIPPLLTRLVTVLSEPTGRRVHIRSDDVDKVVRWIAAATLLLPLDEALGVSFKVYAHNTDYERQRVLGVHPDTAPAVRVGAGGSVFVLDADEIVSDAVDVSSAAELWVSLLSSDADPYDVVDAVEQTQLLATPGEAGQSTGLAVACLLNVDDAVVDESAVQAWLSEASAEQLAEFGTDVGQRVLHGRPTARIVRELDKLAANGTLDLDKRDIRLRLFSAELRDAVAGRPVPPEGLLTVELDPEDRRELLGDWSTAIAQSDRVATAELLHVAWRHRLQPEFAPVQAQIRQFVSELVAAPPAETGKYEPRRWVFSEEILYLLKDHLAHNIDQLGGSHAHDVLSRWWKFLMLGELDFAHPIDKEVIGIAIREGSSAEQARVVDSQLQAAANAVGDAYAYMKAGQALWPTGAPDSQLARRFLAGTPANTFQHIPVLVAAAAALEAEIRGDELNLATLDEVQKARSQGYSCKDGVVIKVLADDEFLRKIIGQLRGVGYFANPDVAAQPVRGVAAKVLRLHLDELTDAMVRGGQVPMTIEVAVWLPLWASKPFVETIAQEVRGRESVAYTALAFQVGHNVAARSVDAKGNAIENAGTAILDDLQSLIKSLDSGAVEEWAGAVAGTFSGSGWTELWDKFVSSAPQGKLRGLLDRHGRSGRED